jgi:hypothetical protein
MPRFVVLPHAQQSLVDRHIPYEELIQTLEQPEAVAPGHAGRVVLMRRFRAEGTAKLRLLRAVVEVSDDTMTVITVYATSKVSKYMPEVDP